LKERSDYLAGTCWQCHNPQAYDVLLDNQLQDKKDLIISTIVKGQETSYCHLLTTSLSTVQKQGEIWNQRLQLHAGELAQALLQNSDLEKDGKSRFILKAKEKSVIEKVMFLTIIVCYCFFKSIYSASNQYCTKEVTHASCTKTNITTSAYFNFDKSTKSHHI
jgi:hypothetical protein